MTIEKKAIIDLKMREHFSKSPKLKEIFSANSFRSVILHKKKEGKTFYLNFVQYAKCHKNNNIRKVNTSPVVISNCSVYHKPFYHRQCMMHMP